MLKQVNETITIEGRIKNIDAYPQIFEFNTIYNHLKRMTFTDLYIKKRPLSEIKKEYLLEYGLTGRHFNSIVCDLKTQISSLEETRKEAIKSIEQQIKSLQKYIKRSSEKIKKFKSEISAIEKYKKQVNLCRQGEAKKPFLKKELRKKHMGKISQEIKDLKYKQHQKKRKFNTLQAKKVVLESRLTRNHLKFCFGGKKLQNAQHHLRENGYSDLYDWKNDWRKHREANSYWIGSHDEIKRNLNAQYDLESNKLRLRLLNCMDEKYLELDVDFPYQKEWLEHAILGERDRWVNGKITKRGVPVSYRLVVRKKACYVQAIFERPAIDKTTNQEHGAIGIDFNLNHLAIMETDRFGNPINGGSYYFSSEGSHKGRNEAQLSDYLSEIVNKCKNSGKVLVVEDLNFEKKKRQLKENSGKRFNAHFSRMAVSRYKNLLKSKCHKAGVEIRFINAAYTSLIGLTKFIGYEKFTSHELSALCIARRGLRMSERCKSKVTFGKTVSIFDFNEVSHKGVKHVWSYWSRMSKGIRHHTDYIKALQRMDSTNPYVPPREICDLSRFKDLMYGRTGRLFERFSNTQYQWVRDKYCSLPAVVA